MRSAVKYNQILEFWKSNKVSNGQGGSYGSHDLDFTDYGYVITKDETRTLQEGQLILEGFYEIYLRFRSDISITKSHIIKLKNKSLTIHSIVNVDELNREIKLIASESENIEIFQNENPYENYQ
jgi:Phage head-tail joining protein.